MSRISEDTKLRSLMDERDDLRVQIHLMEQIDSQRLSDGSLSDARKRLANLDAQIDQRRKALHWD